MAFALIEQSEMPIAEADKASRETMGTLRLTMPP